MDKKKLLISGLTVAGFLATNLAAKTSWVLAEEPTKQEKMEEGKQGACAPGACGAMMEKSEKKEGGEPFGDTNPSVFWGYKHFFTKKGLL